MTKIMLCVFIALIAMTVVMAAPEQCGRHGDSCVSDRECCGTIRCHTYAHRCQVVITPEELMAQRENILNKNKNRKLNY
ncbi:omega-conotoxin-like protein 1 [Hylaeus volcanicus]|uniref:omega-conotoxin-like protein 1 n=1 Tax=Hylaeus volcanicus TaxID=313075 RepID=UPI0023B79846|nr:omega-conotoxin-like protein 1 [Hylaeus volcanicus]